MSGLLTIAAIGVGLSLDAFAAALGRGVHHRPAGSRAIVDVAVIFGLFATLMPALGWMLGHAMSDWTAGWAHVLAFALLLVVGLHMIAQGARRREYVGVRVVAASTGTPDYLALSLTAVATSIDAAAAGVAFALMDIDIALACFVIGGISGAVAAGGFCLGRLMGFALGRRAEISGGLILIATGTSMLVH